MLVEKQGYSYHAGLSGCTPTDCAGGPYGDNDSANYNVFSNYGGSFGPSYSAPVYNTAPSFVPTMCDPRDSLCVVGNVASSVAYQTAKMMGQSDYNYQICLNQLDPAVCRARWPVGYSGGVPFMNLSPTAQAYSMESPSQAAGSYLANPNNANIPGLSPNAVLSAPVNYLNTLGDWVNQLVNSNQQAVGATNPTPSVQGIQGNGVDSGAILAESQSVVGDVLVGVKNIINPSSWGTIFGSGNYLAIAGLVGVPILAFGFFKSKR